MQQLQELYEHWEAVLAAVGAAVIAIEAVVRALQALMGAVRGLANLTKSKRDDEAADRVLAVLQRVHDGLHWAERKLPRGALGKPADSVARISSRPPAPKAAP